MDNKFWLMTIGITFGAMLWRFLPFILIDKIKLSESRIELLKYIPAAVFPAIIFPPVVFHRGTVEIFMGKERMIVLGVAMIVAYLSKNLIATLVSGILLLYFTNYI